MTVEKAASISTSNNLSDDRTGTTGTSGGSGGGGFGRGRGGNNNNGNNAPGGGRGNNNNSRGGGGSGRGSGRSSSGRGGNHGQRSRGDGGRRDNNDGGRGGGQRSRGNGGGRRDGGGVESTTPSVTTNDTNNNRTTANESSGRDGRGGRESEHGSSTSRGRSGRGRGGGGGGGRNSNNVDGATHFDDDNTTTTTATTIKFHNLSITGDNTGGRGRNTNNSSRSRGGGGRDGGRGGRSNNTADGRGRGRDSGGGGRGRSGSGRGRGVDNETKSEGQNKNEKIDNKNKKSENDNTKSNDKDTTISQQQEKSEDKTAKKSNNESINNNSNGGNNNNNNNNRKSGGKDNNNKSGTKSTSSKSNPSSGVSSSASASLPANQCQQTSDINYGKGESIVVVHIAEKPSIAQAIAKGLAGNNPINGYSRALPVHEITGPTFPKAPYATKCRHRVTSVAGHVFSVDFPAQYQSWDAVDPASLFTAPIVRKADKGSIVKHLQDCTAGADFLVLWMDCDREGENINFEVLECCQNEMNGNSTYDRVYRAYFSAINPSDIIKAYQTLGKPDRNQALAVDARQELDLKVGVAFSRYQTRYFQGRYGDLDSGVLSYGPCQTPTLGFCVKRHVEIETFKPEPYWVLELAISKRGRTVKALWDSGRSFEKNKVLKLQETALSSDEGRIVEVTNVTTKDKKQARPIPLNTVALLKACSKALGLGPHAALQIAERLYLSGYLSYPRTESTTYPKSFDIKATLQQQSNDPRWGTDVRTLLQQGHQNSRGGVDMGDHPPITPCRAAGPNELSGDTARVYDLVVRHFIASVSPDAVWRTTRVDFTIPVLGEKGHFTVRGKELVSPGFLAVLLHKQYNNEAGADGIDDDEEERTLPEFVKGDTFLLANPSSTSVGSKVSVASSITTVGTTSASGVRATLEIREKMTSPPDYLTESELIGLMEKHGIGTDASIPTHIENIQKRNYVGLGSGRRLIPQKLGLVLVQGYHLIDSSLVLPQVRSDIEDQCNKIAKGLATREEVVQRAIALFASKFDFFTKNIDRMDLLFGASFSKLEDVGKPFTRCGLSRRYLQYITGPPPRLYNKWTETVYPLPVGGTVKQWSGRDCPVENCHFELCLYSVGQPERTYPLCPRCYNDPVWSLQSEDLTEGGTVPAEDVADKAKERQFQRLAGKSMVFECPLPDHHPVIEELTVSPDPEEDGDGVLIMDPHFGPKWRLNSTRDPTIYYLPRLSIDKVTILNKKDEEYGTHLLQIDFKPDKTPLPTKETKHITNFIDDEMLLEMVVIHHGKERSKPTGRGGRGRGRGRGGRGGRGRGRGSRGGPGGRR